MKGLIEKYYKKKSTWILVIFCLSLNYNLYAQLPDRKINLSVRNKSLSAILENISLQTGFYFTYNSDILPSERRITIELKNIPLKEALDSVFNDPSIGYSLVEQNIVIYRINGTYNQPPEDTSLEEKSFRINGIVVDNDNKEALPFATILINGTRKGTISNLKGEFSIIIPEIRDSVILEVSMIGYKNSYFTVFYSQEEELTIPLERDIISLQEVIIRYQNPLEILSKAIANVPKNYLDVQSAITAYFREYVQRNSEYISYSEVVLNVNKAPYTQIYTNDEVQLVRGRKLENIPADDSLLLRIQSGISSSLQLDVVKTMPLFLNPDFDRFYKLRFNNIVSYKGQTVYVISFNPLVGQKDAIYQGDLFINSEDYSLIAADFSISPEELRSEPGRFLVKKSRNIKIRILNANYRAEYRKTEGKYHISMVTGEVNFRFRRKSQWLSSMYRIGIEMAVTDIQPGIHNPIPRKERVKPATILSEQEFTYDPSFWGDYNIIQPESSLRDALKRMGIDWEDYDN